MMSCLRLMLAAAVVATMSGQARAQAPGSAIALDFSLEQRVMRPGDAVHDPGGSGRALLEVDGVIVAEQDFFMSMCWVTPLLAAGTHRVRLLVGYPPFFTQQTLCAGASDAEPLAQARITTIEQLAP